MLLHLPLVSLHFFGKENPPTGATSEFCLGTFAGELRSPIISVLDIMSRSLKGTAFFTSRSYTVNVTSVDPAKLRSHCRIFLSLSVQERFYPGHCIKPWYAILRELLTY